MQYVLLIVIAFALAAIAWRAKRRTPECAPPYANWDEFARDVGSLEVPLDGILARCGGKLPPKPGCSACGLRSGEIRHRADDSRWTHCSRCSANCPLCLESEHRRRINAEHRRVNVGASPCSFCQQMFGGGK